VWQIERNGPFLEALLEGGVDILEVLFGVIERGLDAYRDSEEFVETSDGSVVSSKERGEEDWTEVYYTLWEKSHFGFHSAPEYSANWWGQEPRKILKEEYGT